VPSVRSVWRARDWSRPSGVKWGIAIPWNHDGTWCSWEFGFKPELMNHENTEKVTRQEYVTRQQQAVWQGIMRQRFESSCILRPEASDVHVRTYSWSLAHMLIYFIHTFFLVLWQPCLLLPNLKSQLLLRSLDVHLIILLHQIGFHLLVSNFVLLQINQIVHQN
jgi:hypothetical protein